MSHPNLLREAVDILLPHVGRSPVEREALLVQAFFDTPCVGSGNSAGVFPEILAAEPVS